MKKIDRLLKVIYLDFPLNKVFPTYQNNKKLSDFANSYFYYTVDKKSDFLTLVKNLYTSSYHKTNNDDEIDLLISQYFKTIKKSGLLSRKEGNTLDLFVHIADKLLVYQSGKITVPFDQLLEWNGLINKVDLNIFFAMKAAIEGKKIELTDTHKIMHDNGRLNVIFSKGLSENHMHLKGSGYTSDMNWQDFVKPDNILDSKFEKIIKARQGKLDDDILGFYKARVIKLYLFDKVLNRRSDFKKYEEYDKRNTDAAFELSQSHKLNHERDILDLLNVGTMDEYELFYDSAKDKLLGIDTDYQCYFKKYFSQDKDTYFAKESYLIERAFLYEMFKSYLNGDLTKLDLYLLNCYLLALNKFKLIFNQSNEGMGFSKFKDSENIKEDLLIDDSFNRVVKSVLDKYYSEGCIRKVEFRVAPKDSVGAYIKLLKNISKLNNEVYKEYCLKEKESKSTIYHLSHQEIANETLTTKKLQFGVIVHFIKDPNDFSDADSISRKEKSFADIKKKVDVLCQFFEMTQTSGLSKLIVGVDTANYELNVRPEVFGYGFRHLRREIAESHHLHFTYHVGEDFLTLANGLRAMDETIEFLGYKRGDRFGHGMALGLDVEKYFKIKQYQIYSTVQDYVDDIVWMHHMISDYRNSRIVQRFVEKNNKTTTFLLQFLEEEFSREIIKFPIEDISLHDYFCAYSLRGDDPEFFIDEKYRNMTAAEIEEQYEILSLKFGARLNFQNVFHKEALRNKKARKLYFHFHYDKRFKILHKEEKLRYEASELYVTCVKLVQTILHQKVYEHEIGIETNPSSNLKISFVDKYIHLPLLAFNNKYLIEDDVSNLNISINSDDSAIFQTDLSQEYSYVVAALFREGYDKESVYEYVNYIRKVSMAQSFVTDDNVPLDID